MEIVNTLTGHSRLAIVITSTSEWWHLLGCVRLTDGPGAKGRWKFSSIIDARKTYLLLNLICREAWPSPLAIRTSMSVTYSFIYNYVSTFSTWANKHLVLYFLFFFFQCNTANLAIMKTRQQQKRNCHYQPVIHIRCIWFQTSASINTSFYPHSSPNRPGETHLDEGTGICVDDLNEVCIRRIEAGVLGDVVEEWSCGVHAWGGFGEPSMK